MNKETYNKKRQELMVAAHDEYHRTNRKRQLCMWLALLSFVLAVQFPANIWFMVPLCSAILGAMIGKADLERIEWKECEKLDNLKYYYERGVGSDEEEYF